MVEHSEKSDVAARWENMAPSLDMREVIHQQQTRQLDKAKTATRTISTALTTTIVRQPAVGLASEPTAGKHYTHQGRLTF